VFYKKNNNKKKISFARLNTKHSSKTRANISAAIMSITGIPVVVKIVNSKVEKSFLSLTETAKSIGVTTTSIKKALLSGKLIKKIFFITKKL
jgi:ABC-type methionine transport system permease subunit